MRVASSGVKSKMKSRRVGTDCYFTVVGMGFILSRVAWAGQQPQTEIGKRMDASATSAFIRVR